MKFRYEYTCSVFERRMVFEAIRLNEGDVLHLINQHELFGVWGTTYVRVDP